MNKLVFSLLLGLLIAACQNTPKSAPETPPAETATKAAAPETPQAATPEAVQEATANLSKGIKMAEDLRKLVDALPASVKKEKAQEIESMYATLEGIIEKETGMLNDIKAPATSSTPAATQDAGGGTGISNIVLNDYNESAARYAQDAQAIQEAVRKMAEAAKKH